ncbi:MAG: hypothetical protein K2I45_02760 [Muribaculaceae bacterium]|nr:hypothetical protein [Muribaculaceae bacterium]
MMKKKVLTLALAAFAISPLAAIAQNTSGTVTTVSKESVKCVMPAKKECTGKARCAANANRYEGLNLTETQLTQLQQLDSRRKEAGKERAKAAKENRQANDSMRRAERKAEKKAYLEQVKAIVGPEQYVVFLENMYVNGGQLGRHKAATFQKNGRKAHGSHAGNERRKSHDGSRVKAAKTATANTVATAVTAGKS